MKDIFSATKKFHRDLRNEEKISWYKQQGEVMWETQQENFFR
jgi:hypothetical protein